jgi:hypothetical protein
MMRQNVEIHFTPETLAYSGPDINQKFAGEDDPVYCERCHTNHRRGAPPDVERERMIQKMAKQVAVRIDADAVLELR